MDAENELRAAAAALLARVDSITSDDFQRGGERPQREHLRAVLRGDAPGEEPWDVLLLERIYRMPEEPQELMLHAVDLMLKFVDC